MAIETEQNLETYTGNNSTVTAYVIPYSYTSVTDLVVTQIDADGARTTLTLTTDYTVSGTDLFTVVAVPVTDTLEIERATAATHDLATESPAGSFAKSIEETFDTVTRAVQDNKATSSANLTRTLRVPRGETVAELASAAARAGYYLGFNSSTGAPELVTANQILGASDGAPTGIGLPAGGSTGQSLVKTSGDDYATEWASGTNITLVVMGDSISDDGTGPLTGGGSPSAYTPIWTERIPDFSGGTIQVEQLSKSGSFAKDWHIAASNPNGYIYELNQLLPETGQRKICVEQRATNDLTALDLDDATDRDEAVTMLANLTTRAAFERANGFEVMVITPPYDNRLSNDQTDPGTDIDTGEGADRWREWIDYCAGCQALYDAGTIDYLVRMDLLLPHGEGFDTGDYQDGVHPTPKGQRKIAREVLRVLAGGEPLKASYEAQIFLNADATLACSAATATKVPFAAGAWTVQYDPHHMLLRVDESATNDGLIRIRESGKYEITCYAEGTTGLTGGNYIYLYLYLGATRKSRLITLNANTLQMEASTIVNLNKGNSLELAGYGFWDVTISGESIGQKTRLKIRKLP